VDGVSGLDELGRRAAAIGRISLVAAVAAPIASAFWVLLLQPGRSGPADVHIPSTAPAVLAGARGGHIAGGPIAALQASLATLLMLVCLAAFVCAIWALATRRKRIGRSAIAILVALNLFRPVSPPMQPIPPVAVEAAAARRLVGLGPVQPVVSLRTGDASTRYVLAQIAYVEGDRAGARRLSAGLDGRDLESPIEAPFRLQFLQGRPVSRSAVCTTTGCFPEPVRALLAAIAAFAALALAGAAAAAWEVQRRIVARCRRIEDLSGARTVRALAA
jgi:hypothetical protein